MHRQQRPAERAKRVGTGLVCICLLLASAVSGCGDGSGDSDVQFKLPDTAVDPADDISGWPIADTSGTELPTRVDAASTDSGGGASDGGSVSDLGGGNDSSSDGGPETKPTITSCASHCGVYLEDNPCHCHESCLGEGSCCADFSAVCKCSKDAECDDANDCTADSCKPSGYCFQQPQKSCCLSDSECGGGDACNTAKCISGTCTLQPMDCDDGIACTADFCDKGECQHKIQSAQCLIDGSCYKAGAADTASGGCGSCDPIKSQTTWTAKAGSCAIDGQCLASGAVNPAAECAVCNPAKSTTSWSAKSGSCWIDGTCYKSGDAGPGGGCLVCDPSSSQNSWSGKSGFCAIDATCYANGTGNPSNPCEVCDTGKSKVAWSAKPGFCNLDGQCVADGKTADGSGGCKVCDAKQPTAWVIKTGASCNSGSICISAAKCDASGQCLGTQKPGCCAQDKDCDSDPKLAPGPCEFKGCNTTSGSCELKTTPGCCTSGVCCDAFSKTFKPQGTVCGTLALDYEFKCEGDTGYKRARYAGCTGSDASKCSSMSSGFGEWVVAKKCSIGDICVVDGSSGSLLCKTP